MPLAVAMTEVPAVKNDDNLSVGDQRLLIALVLIIGTLLLLFIPMGLIAVGLPTATLDQTAPFFTALITLVGIVVRDYFRAKEGNGQA
jgi:hypothetical protein